MTLNQARLESSGLTEAELDMVARGNAQRLFPRLACGCGAHGTGFEAGPSDLPVGPDVP